ncbi:hypothetical protein RZS08_12325, partial [Arthrospira platensis SPKY1]|nr:hypothetical protein [Arthrospira platensis SPKY1]
MPYYGKLTFAMTKFGVLLLAFLALALQGLAQEKITFFYSETDIRNTYPLAVLKLALSKSGVEYEMIETKRRHENGRIVLNQKLGLDTKIDVLWTFSTPEFEEAMIPIPIPIDRGLLGWRVFIIHQDDQAFFDQADEATIRQQRSIQEQDWA